MRVLISRLSAVGDIVHTWPLVSALRHFVPDAALAWLVEEPLTALVSRHPAIWEAIPVATRRWRRSPFAAATRREIGRTLDRIAAFGADVALDPQGLLKSATWAWRLRVPRRIGLSSAVRRERAAGLFYTGTVKPPESLRHVVDLSLSLLTALDIEPPYGDSPDGRFLLAASRSGADTAARRVAIVPSAGAAEKRWGAAAWGDLAARVKHAGLLPLVLWGPGEERLARAVVDRSNGAAELAPPTTLEELCGLLAGCRAVVGGDTGPVHLAASLGTPTLAVYLATDPARNGPRGARVNVVTGATAAEGAARRARTGRARGVSVEEVHTALVALLQRHR